MVNAGTTRKPAITELDCPCAESSLAKLTRPGEHGKELDIVFIRPDKINPIIVHPCELHVDNYRKGWGFSFPTPLEMSFEEFKRMTDKQFHEIAEP